MLWAHVGLGIESAAELDKVGSHGAASGRSRLLIGGECDESSQQCAADCKIVALGRLRRYRVCEQRPSHQGVDHRGERRQGGIRGRLCLELGRASLVEKKREDRRRQGFGPGDGVEWRSADALSTTNQLMLISGSTYRFMNGTRLGTSSTMWANRKCGPTVKRREGGPVNRSKYHHWSWIETSRG